MPEADSNDPTADLMGLWYADELTVTCSDTICTDLYVDEEVVIESKNTYLRPAVRRLKKNDSSVAIIPHAWLCYDSFHIWYKCSIAREGVLRTITLDQDSYHQGHSVFATNCQSFHVFFHIAHKWSVTETLFSI